MGIMFIVRLVSFAVGSLLMAAIACSGAPAPLPTPTPTATAAPVPTATPIAAAPTAPPVPTTTSIAPAPTATPAPPPPPAASDANPPETVERDLKIVTLLPYDAIPAILAPEFITAEEADEKLDPGSLVIGLSIDGDRRAYSIPTLSSYEIVNDTVGGKPVAITW